MEAKMTNGSLSALDPYACPEEVENVYAQLKEVAATRKDELVPVPERFKLNPDVRLRSETFGIVVFIGIHKAGMYNLDAAGLLTKLNDGRVHELADFLKEQPIGSQPDNTVRFFSTLYKRGIILGG